MLTDLRYAVRSLSRSKGFVLLVVVSLGLALGLNTTVYAILDTILHPFEPRRDIEQLYSIYAAGDPRETRVTALDRYRMIRDGTPIGSGISVYAFDEFLVEGPSSSVSLMVADVSTNYFDVEGVSPLLGRAFTADGSDPSDLNSIVLGEWLWNRLFPGRTSPEGASVLVNDQPYAVIGVVPTQTTFQAYRIIPPSALESGSLGTRLGRPRMIVRVTPPFTSEAAMAALQVVAQRLTDEHGVVFRPFQFGLGRYGSVPRLLSGGQKALAGAAALVLLIACANLANLMLARGIARRRELAMRMAIGASRVAIVRQLAAESVILAAAGGVLGVLAATWAMDILGNQLPVSVRMIGILQPEFSWRVVAFGLAAAGLTIVVFGLMPAWQASNVDVSEPLKESAGTTTGRHRGRYSALVITEVALSMVLLLSAGLMARTVQRLNDYDFGYDTDGLWSAQIFGFRRIKADPDDMTRRIVRTIDGVRQVRGVQSVAAFGTQSADGGAVTSDAPGAISRVTYLQGYAMVSADFLRTLGIPVTAGRDFLEGDREAGAVIVDEETSRWLWPEGGAVGRLLKLGAPDSPRPWLRVIGIARPARFAFTSDPDLTPAPQVYVVSRADSNAPRQLAVRISGDVSAASGGVAAAVKSGMELESHPRLTPWSSLDTLVAGRRFVAQLFVAFGGFALLLAGVGLYGVLAYSVSQRTREFAIRIALGATRPNLFRLVIRDGFVMVLSGTIAGAILGMWSAQLLNAWLYAVLPADGWVLLSAEAALCLAAFAACLAPARKATRANPVDILRAV